MNTDKANDTAIMRKDTGWDSQYTYNDKTDLKECAIDESMIEEVFWEEDDLFDKNDEEGKLEIFHLLDNIKNKKTWLT